MAPRSSHWLISVAVCSLALAVYLGAALAGGIALGGAVAGAATGAMAALAFFIGHRWVTTGKPFPAARMPVVPTARIWGMVAAGFVLCWIAGQTAAIWLGSVVHSPNWEANAEARAQSPAWLLVLTALVLAPIGEEALVRGVIFARMRRHLPLMASAIASAAVFALLHANVIQIAATLPIGVLLALAYEASGRLWVPIGLHVAFNLLATIVPVGAIAAITSLPTALVAVIAAGIALTMLASLLEPAPAPAPAV